MNKVFGVGLSKTGTTSLNAALVRLGYRAKHYPVFPQIIEAAAKYDALTDTPVIPFMEALDRLYPDAKFILTVRELESWLDSCRRHWARKDRTKLKPRHLWGWRSVYGVDDFDEGRFRIVYFKHNRHVKDYFRGREGKLLVLDVCAGEGYERLCPFLGLETLYEKFPYENKAQDIEYRLR